MTSVLVYLLTYQLSTVRTKTLTRNSYPIVHIQRPRYLVFVDQSESSTSKGSDEGRRQWDPVTHRRDKPML